VILAVAVAAYLLVPTLGVVALGLLWTWRLAYGRPELRTAVRLTLAAAGLALLYPLPLAGLIYGAWQRTFLPFELVVPDDYVGPAVIVACADAGDAPDGQLVLPANGVARVRVPPDDLVARANVRARSAGGAERTANRYTWEVPPGSCGWFELVILPEPGDPRAVAYSSEGLRAREARAVAEGRTFAEVSADPLPEASVAPVPPVKAPQGPTPEEPEAEAEAQEATP
jgi:hypothetical protein